MRQRLRTAGLTLMVCSCWFTQAAFTVPGGEWPQRSPAAPASGAPSYSPARSQGHTNEVGEFVNSITNGRSDEVVGLFLADGAMLSVEPQPAGYPGYVTSAPGSVTRFALASHKDVDGFLAHGELGGSHFVSLSPGDPIVTVMGDGVLNRYKVIAILRFKALRPNDPFSTFIDLDHESSTVTNHDVFQAAYGLPGSLVLQTCIARGSNQAWGRLFVIAIPDDAYDPLVKLVDLQ